MTSITIDGPAGAGKTTVAKALSKKLGYVYFNTGAVYRAIAYCYLIKPFDLTNIEILKKFLSQINIKITHKDNAQYIWLNDSDITQNLSTPDMDNWSSKISQYREVREFAVALQRNFAKNQNIVIEGRDIGSNVLPNAEFKFYLTASVEVRADRRQKQYFEQGGQYALISYKKILEDIIERDKTDTQRAISPLIVPKGAIIINSDRLTIEEVVNNMFTTIQGG